MSRHTLSSRPAFSRGARRKVSPTILFSLLVPAAAQSNPNHNACFCSDVWDSAVTVSETNTSTCGRIIRTSPQYLQIDQLAAANAAATSQPAECDPCGMPLSRQRIIEPVYPKVQCLADCLPGGASHGMAFCGAADAPERRRHRKVQHAEHHALLASSSDLEAANVMLEASAPEQSCLAPGDDEHKFLQMAIARGPAPRPTVHWPERASLGEIKLVINAAGNRDSTPITQLFKSLAAVNFTAWDRVVVVNGGANADRSPRLVQVQQVAEVPYTLEWNVHCVLIDTTLMNYDLHGFAMLQQYHNDPLISARGYFYMHDTSQAEPDFMEALQRLDALLVTPTTVLTVPPPNANIVVMGAGVPSLFNSTFEIPLTKHQGISLEYGMRQMSMELCNTTDAIKISHSMSAYKNDYWGEEMCRDTSSRLVSPVLDFSDNVHFLGRRTLLCSDCTVFDNAAHADVYNTGQPRVVLLYRQFGIRKFILWGASGDLRAKPVVSGVPEYEPWWMAAASGNLRKNVDKVLLGTKPSSAKKTNVTLKKEIADSVGFWASLLNRTLGILI